MEAIKITPIVFQVEADGHKMTFRIGNNRASPAETFVTVYNEEDSVDFMFKNSNTKRLALIGEMLIAIAKQAEALCEPAENPPS